MLYASATGPNSPPPLLRSGVRSVDGLRRARRDANVWSGVVMRGDNDPLVIA